VIAGTISRCSGACGRAVGPISDSHDGLPQGPGCRDSESPASAAHRSGGALRSDGSASRIWRANPVTSSVSLCARRGPGRASISAASYPRRPRRRPGRTTAEREPERRLPRHWLAIGPHAAHHLVLLANRHEHLLRPRSRIERVRHPTSRCAPEQTGAVDGAG
jgi:hypothetical protein